MPRHPSTELRKAFTLLELLLVAFIVGILAALALPVLSKAKGRGKQIECLSQLKQIGLASHQFSHDHGGRFPFQVPVKDGGTLELVQAANSLGDVQYAFRHFQALSNDLDNPKLLACPADRRIVTNAVAFSSLRNDHISYFVAVTADYSRPESLLAGDRNIVTRGGNPGSVLRIASDTEVAWTSEVHEYKGNLLFAGGHVERTGKSGLQVAMQSLTGPIDAWMPTGSSAPGRGAPGSSGGASGGGSGGAGGSGASPSSGKSGGGGGASSGFAALQKFFETPLGPAGAPPASPAPPPVVPDKPVYAAAPEPTIVEQPPVAVLPSPAPKRVTNQVPTTPTRTPTPVEAESTWTPEPPPSVLAVFVEPERCWWCWILFLVVSVAASVTLGVLIHRRQRKRLREAGDSPD